MNLLGIATATASSVLILSFFMAILTGDPHWCQRGGALLAALAAFLAIIEASVEHDYRLHETERLQTASPLADLRGANSNMIDRIRRARFRSQSTKLSYDKVKAVFWISSIAVVGEIFHGFGDLVFEVCKEIWRSALAWY